MSVNEIQKDYDVRLRKVEALQASGYEPWPEFRRNTTTAGVLVSRINENNYSDEEKVLLSGRLILKRDHGKTYFGTLRDYSGSVQIYLKMDVVGTELFDFFLKFIDMGDFLWVMGTPFVTKTGEATIKVLDFALISKSLRPLPDKFHGLVDVEHRYRQRYLDLLANQVSADRFVARSKIIHKIREFLVAHNFLEVETPMLHPIAGGANARPFITHHNAYDIELFLRIAPELYLKRLVVGGFDRVFEINRNFRNEGVSTRHNPEFSMLEFYMAYGDYLDGINLTSQLLKNVAAMLKKDLEFDFGEHKISFATDFAVMSIEESLMKVAGFSVNDLSNEFIDELFLRLSLPIMHDASRGEKLYKLFEETVEKKLIQPTFITGFPIEVSPLAKRDNKNPALAARFEFFLCGMELANGYSELNDPLDQAERFNKQLANKEKGDLEAHDFDKDYVLALEHGLPPTVGVGIGIDRLVMILTNTTSIKDVILFPTMRPEN